MTKRVKLYIKCKIGSWFPEEASKGEGGRKACIPCTWDSCVLNRYQEVLDQSKIWDIQSTSQKLREGQEGKHAFLLSSQAILSQKAHDNTIVLFGRATEADIVPLEAKPH